MCGRYALGGDVSDYAEYLGVAQIVDPPLPASYNVAPTDPVYAAAEWDGERMLVTMRWGFVPHWAKDHKAIQINARSETVADAPMFRDSFSRKRCLIPADGFYEWEPKDRGRQPHWVHLIDQRPMVFAGIYSTIRDPVTDQLLRTSAILTTAAQGRIEPIHNRMPVTLPPTLWDDWLDRELRDTEEVNALLQSVEPELIEEYPVSARVNSVRNNDPTLNQPGNDETAQAPLF